MGWQKINGVIWALDKVGDPANLVKPSDTAIKTGYPQGKPNRQNDNWILEELHNNLSYLETNGWPTWDATVTYDTYALVRYGTKHYISIQTTNLNKDPSTEITWWKDYFVWLTEQAGTEQTNQTVANYNAGYFYPHPEFVSGTTVNLTGDNLLGTDLTLYPLSSNPLAITVPTTVANTWYYVYVDIPAGSDIVAGDVSITTVTPSFDPATGLYKSGTKRCIGYIEGHNTGNGEAEPFIVAEGWYQRRDKKRRLALYTPAPNTGTTLYSGVPNFDGRGIAEVLAVTYEELGQGHAFVDDAQFSGTINASDLTDFNPGFQLGFNGQSITGIFTEHEVSVGAACLVSTDSSGNILVAAHTAGSDDEMMAVWLKKFKLPRGIFSR